MKYRDMQSAIARSERAKAKQRDERAADANQPGLTAEMDSERWLLERIKQAGGDVYCEGEFEALADRLAHVIRREQLEQVICGRGPNGKPERFPETWSRLYGREWRAAK